MRRGSGSASAKRSSSRRVTVGASSASPRGDRRGRRRPAPAGRTSLSRKPLAPARSASKTYSSRSKVVRTMTRAALPAATIRRVASMPVDARHPDVHQDDVGRARAGERDRLARRRRPRRRPRCPRLASRIMRKPPRTSAWSSASRTRIIIAPARAAAGPARGSRRRGRGPASSVPPSSAARSRIPASPRPPPRRPRRARRAPSSRTSSSSAPSARSARVTSARLRAARGAACSSAPPGRSGRPTGRRRPAARRRRRPRGAARRRARRPAAARRARRAASRPGCGARPSALVAGRGRGQQAAQLGERLAPGALDRAQRRARLVGPLVEDVAGRRGLHDDHRDAVGDHVVQLAGDAAPLLARPRRRERLLDRGAPCGRPRRAPRRPPGRTMANRRRRWSRWSKFSAVSAEQPAERRQRQPRRPGRGRARTGRPARRTGRPRRARAADDLAAGEGDPHDDLRVRPAPPERDALGDPREHADDRAAPR